MAPVAEDKNQQVRAALQEMNAAKDFRLTLEINLASICAIVAAIRLALRNPRYNGHSAIIARHTVGKLIHRVRQAGFTNTAELLAMGDDGRTADLPIPPVSA